MTTEAIPTITFEDFKNDSHLINYVDDNLIILDNIATIRSTESPVRIECFLMVFCIEGEVETKINNKYHTLKAEHCAILFPNAIVQYLPQETPCNIRIVVFSSDFIKGNIYLKKETWNISYYLYRNPILPINRNASYKLYLYKELVLTCIHEKKHPYSKEATMHLFASIFYQFLAALNENIPNQKVNPNLNNDRSTYIFRKFMEKVLEDDGSHRSVAYFADMLCYSPKHLSTVVKRISGKAPLTIINDHAIECIKSQLRHSDMSMKEIADMFDFSNPSFFGKFVKHYLGMSPLQYRTSHSDDKE